MEYRRKREQDMNQLEHDEFLNTLRNFHGGKEYGISMSRQMPYYHLYDQFINQQVKKGFKREKFKDYQKYSIGFLTRGRVRHCPFCVNKLENRILPYSKLQWFLDDEKDKNGKLVRPYIYLWDDNFLASDPSIWRPLLKQLIETKRPFQFRQGLDERMLAKSRLPLRMVRQWWADSVSWFPLCLEAQDRKDVARYGLANNRLSGNW